MKEQILAVQRMQDFIENNKSEEISLSDLARASLFSPWYAYRLFRDYLGLTPTEYIRKYRLTQAAKQLRSGNERKRSNYICNELFTWVDVYDTANHDERRAILQQFIKEIRVRKDYEISITLNASFNQVEQLKAVSTYDGAEIFEEISEKGA